MKVAFAVGKSDRKTRQMLILSSVRAPIAGPFILKAITQSTH
jgi:hypothetical protein